MGVTHLPSSGVRQEGPASQSACGAHFANFFRAAVGLPRLPLGPRPAKALECRARPGRGLRQSPADPHSLRVPRVAAPPQPSPHSPWPLAHWGPAGMRNGWRLNQLRAGLCLLLASLQLVSWTLAGEAGRRAGKTFGDARETPRRVCKGEIVRNGCHGDMETLGSSSR